MAQMDITEQLHLILVVQVEEVVRQVLLLQVLQGHQDKEIQAGMVQIH